MDYFTNVEKITLISEIIIYSFLFSLIIIFIKKAKKEFNTAFHHLLLVIFVAHFVMWPLVTLFSIKLWRFGFWRNWYLNNGWVASSAFSFSAYIDNVIYLAQTLIAFNRFTCLWLPLQQKAIWKRKWYLVLTVLLPILTVCYRFHAEGYYRVNPDGSVQGGNVDKQLEAINPTINACTLGANTFFSFFLNILTIYKLKKESQASMVPVDKSAELITYSVILTVVQCVRFAYNRMRAIFILNAQMIFILVTLYSYVNAAHVITASVGLLILSRMTRETYFDFYIFPILPSCLSWKKYFKPAQSSIVFPQRNR